MELDERLRWIEIRVASSLKPRAEELKRLFSNKENREIMFEFCNNEERRYLMIFSSNVPGEGLIASFKAPGNLVEKAMFFCKTNQTNKLLRDNIANDVGFCDCSRKPLKHLKRLVKDVYLPVLSIEHGGSVSADKLMDLLHRVVANLHVFDGNNENKVALSLPCIEVLSEAAAFSGRRPAVIHVLETTVVNWIKQIKVALKLDPEAEIIKCGGTFPGPLTEVEMWSSYLSRLNFINEQLRSPVAVNIIINLEDANSTYGQSFHLVKKELAKAEAECHENLQYLGTLVPWFNKLHHANTPSLILRVFPPLMHTLYLVWVHSRYYHEKNHFHRLTCMLSNEVVARAKSLVDHNVLDKLDESFQSLKDALRICASFRGCYLDKKDKADVLNQKKLLEAPGSSLEQSELHRQKRGLTERGGRSSIFRKQSAAQQIAEQNIHLWTDSPWPARNKQVFGALNSFMERCNDVLELVQTTTHFKMLRLASEIGGAGGTNLNSLVEEIYGNFQEAIEKIQGYNLDVLEVKEAHQFEKAFFAFRSVMRSLERRLADVLRQSFKQCPDTEAKLRLLEVFEGTSGRELVQENLFDICDKVLVHFIKSVEDIKDHFEQRLNNPPVHVHLPLIASKLMWLKGLKARVDKPMSMFRRLSISSFKGDKGWKLRDTYSDLVKDIERAELQTTLEWQNSIQEDLRTKLKQSLLIEVKNSEQNPTTVQVNLDPDLLSLLKEIYYLADPPFLIRLPDPARLLLRSISDSRLRTTATRLETIVSRYNAINKNIQPNEHPLFERKLTKIEELLEEGINQYTWKTVESADFVEHLCSLVCEDVHKNLCVVQSNYNEISDIVMSWSLDTCLDAFSSREKLRSYSIEELNALHRETHNVTEHSIVMGGHRIHGLLLSTFEAVQISRASPAWQNYIQCVSELVLEGLKKSVLVSLKGMINEVNCTTKDKTGSIPILTIRLELSGSQVVFNPKLDEDDATSSVQEYVEGWIEEFLKRADMVKPFEPGLKTYHRLIADVDEVQKLMSSIRDIVRNNGIQCQNVLGTFRQYAFLWMQDVERTFKEFLAGHIVAHPRDMSGAETLRSGASLTSQRAKKDKGTRCSSEHTPGAYSLDGSGALGLSEKTFLNANKNSLESEAETATVPSLDDFDKELEIFRASRDEICGLQDWCDIGFTRVNMRPIKQVLQTYASKWMFTYTKYLSDQVSNILNDLDSFLKRIEPGVEAITGEERDITSFMRLMRIFNEINTQQAEMDSKFIAMKRSINLLEKYDQKLPETTQKFYAAAPQKWNNLKMKVAQAKQRLGPRIQSEAKSVTAELEAFGKRCDLLVREFMASEAFKRKCLTYTAYNIMDMYEKRMKILENEAQDLIELQELLEKNIVNFSVLPQVESDLECLRDVWNMFRAVQNQQNEWKRQRWLKLNTKLLQNILDEQLQQVSSLPYRSHSWDVHIGMLDTIVDMQACLPIMEDLQKAALRPRHWKQLLRLAGENLHVVANDGLMKMSLGQLIEFGLHHHTDEVRTIIQKATKDVAIESSLKTYEEVWLSKVFELKRYKKARVSSAAMVTGNQEVTASEIDSEAQGHAGHRGLSGRYSVTSYGSGGLSHKESKTRRTTPSLASGAFSQSLINLTQDSGPLCLLTNCDPIFEELESHQVSLQSMLCGSAASSFTDEIQKWQKQLQTIEAVLTVWLEVQDNWVELEDIYGSFEVRIALPHEANLFAAVNRDFRVLMKATERNTNVLQSCARTNIQAKLEKMQSNLQQCWKSLLALLERRQQKFPRFYFLSTGDVLHVVCNGHHPALVNPYLSNVYENIVGLQYRTVVENHMSAYHIWGVVSKMDEALDLPEAIVCDSTIENWLQEVEKSMKSVLNGQLTDVINKFGDAYWQSLNSTDGEIEKTWMLETAAEIVLLVTHIDLSSNIERCLKEHGQEKWNSLKEQLNKIKATITTASRMLKSSDVTSIPAKSTVINRNSLSAGARGSRPSTRGEIQSLYSADSSQRPITKGETPSHNSDSNTTSLPYQYQKLVNLIILLIHKRDFIHKLLGLLSNGSRAHTQSFEWSSQVKYNYSKEDGSLFVKILDTSISYGMEYQGACSRLVLTPMTDKCFVSLAQAVKCHMVGTCVGPSGSGKNETIRDFARLCGQPFYPFACANKMDPSFLTGVFKGLAMTGAWICFGKINVMDQSILSVVVQLIQGVMDSLKIQKSSVLIENEDVNLVQTAACFTTMSPTRSPNEPFRRSFDYFTSVPSALSELPSGLGQRLRSVSFTRPDTRIISEVFLVTNGFTTASQLSDALFKLQNLCETFIPSFNYVSGQLQDLPACMVKGSGWSILCIKKIINDAANNLYENGFSETSHDDDGNVEVLKIPGPAEEVHPAEDRQESQSAECANHAVPDDSRLPQLEERALVEAIRDTFLPGLSLSDTAIFATLIVDVFLGAEAETIFQTGNQEQTSVSNEPEQVSTKPAAELSILSSYEAVTDDEPSAVSVAMTRLGLQSGVAFEARAAQLAQLVAAHKTVAVVGPSGCGKTDCIKTVAAAHREMGRILRRDIICTGALESFELMGYYDSNTSEWKDGLLPRILRRYAQQLKTGELFSGVKSTPFTKWIHLDGIIDSVQGEAFDTVIQNNGAVVFQSGERINVPASLEIIWEIENLEHVSPATVCQIGLMCMTKEDVSWQLLINRWISKKQEREAEVLRSLCDRYIGPTLEFLSARTSVPPRPGAAPTNTKYKVLEHVVCTSEINMVETLIALVDASISHHSDLMPAEYENHFNFAAIWAFGGTLIESHRVHFSEWWKNQWKDIMMLPGNEEVWNYFVSPDTHEFCSWNDAIQPYVMPHGEGISQNAYVHTVYNEGFSHVVGILSETGRPVMFVGEQGCGKTSIVRDKLNNQDDDVAEFHSLSVYCNEFTTSRSLWQNINNCLEWKHGRTYIPKGNKKLICLVDDLNLSKKNDSGIQSSTELIRQLIDHGGVFDPETYQWREVQDVTYITTYNPHISTTVPKIGNRLLRHFSLFHIPYPSVDALEKVYFSLLGTHFLAPRQLATVGSVTKVLLDNATSGSIDYLTEGVSISSDNTFKELLSKIVRTTIELQNELRVMYLPTAQRCHYVFTLTNLTMVFRNLCLSLREGCSVKDLLLLWRHECDWVYNRRLVDSVDRERYQQTFVNTVKKEFSSSEQVQIMISDDVLFTNLVEVEDSGLSGTGESTTGGSDENIQLAYRPLHDVKKVKTVLSHGIAEYNKDFPKIKLSLYDDTIEAICRLVRVIQSPHECSHALIVSEGSPGATSSIVKLAAHLCGFSLCQINASSVAGTAYTISNFRNDLVSAYRRAGVKREKLLFLLGENDLVNKDMMVHISEFLVSSSIAHLFSEEERTSAINSVRSDVTQAGLTYTKGVAWRFFLRTVKENLRMILSVSSPTGSKFQQRCRDFPGLINSISIMFFPHWSRENLVSRGTHLLRDMELFDISGKENMAHLFASIHLSLREHDPSEDASGYYGHITNTTFEKFVERFNNLFKKRYTSIREEYGRMASALENISKAAELAGQRLKQLEHEKIVLDQKKESNLQLLSQIGQDKAIAEEQIKLITRQRQKIFHLQMALPKFKDAHERSVFKAAAVVSDIKRMLRVLDVNALGELRAIQKPDPEIEDILATVIIILKSPTSDLTWNKGAKRIMANLDRFRDDLAMFDDLDITESTLQILESYLGKPHFDHVYMNNRTENPALVMLVKWVSGVAKYHQMMISKVKPLHVKVEETTKTVNEASCKLAVLQNKLQDLEARLFSLANAYEEASIDKCRQFKLTQKLNQQLERASYFENVLSKAREKWSKFLQTISNREAAIAGAVCMAAAFATYLGPYKHSFRRKMLTIHWPECLQERGVPLLLDDTPHTVIKTDAKGAVIEHESESPESEELDKSKRALSVEEESHSGDDEEEKVFRVESSGDGQTIELESEDFQSIHLDEEQRSEQDNVTSTKSSGLQSSNSPKYDAYLLSLMKSLVGGHQVRQWLNSGMGMRLMENASISMASWQRPPFLIDPHGRGLELVRRMEKHEKVVEIDVGDGDIASLMHIEKAITSGSVLVLHNVNENVDSIFLPLIYRINTNTKDGVCDDLQSVNCGGRRLSCHPNFKLYLLSSSHTISFTPEIASITTLVNFTLENESFAEEILSLSLSRVQPEMSQESKKTMNALMENLVILEDLDSKIITRLSHRQGTNVWDDTELIADMVQCRAQITKRHENAIWNLDKVGLLKEKYAPFSQLVTVLFNAINSLSAVQHEYRFSIEYFLKLFDIALSKVIPSTDVVADTDESRDDTFSREIMIQVVDEEGNATQHKWTDDYNSSQNLKGQNAAVILPPEVELPTPGITHEAISDDVIGQLIDELTKGVFESLFRSIYSHHRLTFGTLLSSVIHQHTTHDDNFDKRMEYLITGGLPETDHLSLADFDPTLLTPSWVPPDRWQSLLSLSTLPGPLEGLCTKVASDPKWQEWYYHDRPESLSFPGIDEDNGKGDQEEDEQTQDTMTDFHGLLILRCLRPDRLTAAMREYVGEILDNLQAHIYLSLSEILTQIEHSIPILVLLPDSSFCEMSVDSPAKAILQLAERENIPCQHLIVASGHENRSDIALATAVRSDSWVIIENIHCASFTWLRQLYVRLERLHCQAETASSPGQWRVFLTTKPSSILPQSLLYLAHPLAWDVVQLESSQLDRDVRSFDDHLNVDLVSAIITSLNRIPLTIWEEVKRGSLFIRTTIFRLCILHGILCARQEFGSRAMVKEYPFSLYDLEHAINLCIQLCVDQEINDSKIITKLCFSIIDIIYGGKMTEQQDHEYRECLTRQIFETEQESSLTIGEITFPLPPMNVEPSEYGQWLKEKLQVDGQRDLAVTAVQPDCSVKMESDEYCTLSIAKDLGILRSDSPDPVTHDQVNMTALRRNLDMCLERLPTLLNLDAKKSASATILLPSVLSQLRALSLTSETNSVVSSRDENLSETINYALQQECEWFNAILCHVRQSLYTLEECVLRGSHALPWSINDVVIPLQYGLVPCSWLHVNWQPASHSLDSWLEEFQRCHKQLETWIGKHYVPSPEQELTFRLGTLDKIWLGGLVNPAALITSLKHEKAASCECSIEDVSLVSYIVKNYCDNDVESGEGITLIGLYLEGGLWEINEGLIPSSTPLSKMPDVFVKAVYTGDTDKEIENIYNCPLYRNRSRQYSPFKLPLQCSARPDELVLKGVALIIDPGEIHGSWKLRHRAIK